MPQQAWSRKRERQYEDIKDGQQERGTSEGRAEEIAARTVNQQRARSGEAAHFRPTDRYGLEPEAAHGALAFGSGLRSSLRNNATGPSGRPCTKGWPKHTARAGGDLQPRRPTTRRGGGASHARRRGTTGRQRASRRRRTGRTRPDRTVLTPRARGRRRTRRRPGPTVASRPWPTPRPGARVGADAHPTSRHRHRR